MREPRDQILLEASFSIGESWSCDVGRNAERGGLTVVRSLDDPVQRSEASLLDLPLSSFLRIAFGSEAKSFSRQVLGVEPNAETNVVAGYYERAAALVLPP